MVLNFSAASYHSRWPGSKVAARRVMLCHSWSSASLASGRNNSFLDETHELQQAQVSQPTKPEGPHLNQKGLPPKKSMAFQVFVSGSRFRGNANETGGNAMKQKPLTCLNASLLLAAMTCPAGEILASEAPDITISIHVYNYAAVSEKTLARAKEEAGWIFVKAGLTALWVDHALSAVDLRHPHHSTDSWDRTDYALRLLTQSRETSSKNAIGEALSLVLSPYIANVFMNRVTEQAAAGELSASRMLGHAIAHEIGHLLLGDNPHSPRGIMVAPWSKQHLWRMSKGNLLFTHEEVTRIQSEVRHRSRSVPRVAD